MYDYDIHEAIYQYRQYEINVTWFRGSGPGAGPIIMATVKMLKNISQSSKINLKQRYDVHNVFFLNCEIHRPQDNGSGFFIIFCKEVGDICPFSERGFLLVFFFWSLESLRYSSSDSCPHPPLPTFMNGCLQIIKVGLTFRRVLDQGLDSKIEA